MDADQTTLTAAILRYGSAAPLPPQRVLRAGMLSVVYEAGDLRYITWGAHEVLRRVYVAVRDPNWDTIPAQISGEQIHDEGDHFTIRYLAQHRHGAIDFSWHATITGAADGTITWAMDGIANRTFQTNRTGFCVLHPLDSAGAAARASHSDGTVSATALPLQIAPQQISEGKPQPVAPFSALRGMAHEVAPARWAELTFTGDVFELEDQRNWLDGSFKTYSRPLRLPFPYQISAGERVQQTVRLALRTGAPPSSAPPAAPAATTLTVTIGPVTERRLPALGLGCASHGQALSAPEARRLQALHLAHLRHDLPLDASDYAARLRQASAESAMLGVPLELALFVSDRAPAELAELRHLLDELRPAIARWLIFHHHEPTTSARWIRLARATLGSYAPAAPFAGGTNAYFTDLNRDRPDTAALDMVTYSINPQVHAFDNASLVETAPTVAVLVASARAFSGGKPISVSPITLKPRFNPTATGPEPPPEPGALPPQVDPRQMSLFGAGWTLATLRYLAESGVASATYYETTGWRGVIATAAGSPLPERFPALPGAVFPLYHVFADIGELAGGHVLAAHTPQPRTLDLLAIRAGQRTRVLLANLTNLPQRVQVAGLAAQVQVRLLDERTALHAMHAPEAYRAAPGTTDTTSNGSLELELLPYAIARIDGDADQA